MKGWIYMKSPVGISNRHVHLDKSTYEYLFEREELQKRNDLNQIGEFASTDVLSLEYGDKTIDNVRIVGPFREHNQIELLKSDLEYLGIDAPTRRSGDLENTPQIKLKVKDKSIITDGVIKSEIHLHVPTSMEQKLGLHERDVILITAPRGSFKANVKVSNNGYYELHIDKDEKELYGIDSNAVVDIEKIDK